MYIVYNWSIHKKMYVQYNNMHKGIINQKNIYHISHLVHYIVHHCKWNGNFWYENSLTWWLIFFSFCFSYAAICGRKRPGQIRYVSFLRLIACALRAWCLVCFPLIKIIFKERITYFFYNTSCFTYSRHSRLFCHLTEIF